MDRTIEARLKRLMLFRVVMVTTLLLIAAYVEAVSETLLRVNPLYFVIAATYVLTLVHVIALRVVSRLEPQVYGQVIGDLVTITCLVYLTGGTGSSAGFMLLYPISVLSGSVLLYRGKGLVLAGLATIFYGSILLAVRTGAVPSWGMAEVPYLPTKHLLYSIFVVGVGCATVAVIGSYLSESLEKAGERVADLQELNKVIVTSIQSGLITAEVEGRVLYVNAFGVQVLGLAAEGILGRTLHEVFSSRLLDAPALRARAAHLDLRRLDIPYRRPDGFLLELGISVSPLEASEPQPRGYLLVFKDVTEIKRLEHEVRVKEKLAAVGEMAAQLAHEIRNPLGSISGSAQVLRSEPNLSPEQHHLLSIIMRESKRLSEALSEFLHEVKPPTQPSTPVDVGPVIDEAVTLLRNGPEVKLAHHIEFRRDDGPHLCLADPHRITQVFWNLARNGLEAMPDGGTLSIHLTRQEEEVVLAVQDEGCGMLRSEQRSIFEPFRSSRPMGTGLGLAIVYRIVREHRGDIRVRSTPSLGTRVEVCLPLVAVPAHA